MSTTAMPPDVTSERFRAALVVAMGPLVRAALDDARTIEVMANADGHLWVERAGVGREAVGIIAPTQVESLIRLVADHAGERADLRHPLVSGTLPADGSGGGSERF